MRQFYSLPVQKRVIATLQQQQLERVAHILWITDDRIQCDLVILDFATEGSAQAQLDFTEKINYGDGTLQHYSLDSLGAPTVYHTTTVNAQGYQTVKGYAILDHYVVEMFVYAPTDVPQLLVNRWLQTQVSRLPV